MQFKLATFWGICSLIISLPTAAQEVRIELGDNEIGLNQVFTISIVLENDQIRNYDGFPEIPGFTKRGTSSQTSTNFVNGKMSSTQSIVQNYAAQKQGEYELPAFTMTINGKKVRSPGTTIRVGPPVQRRDPLDAFSDPFDDFLGNRNRPQEFVAVEDDAFLALSTSKDEVYLGEGFTATLAFYVPRDNRAQMEFYDLGKQLTDILKDIRPANAWEENFNIENINRELIRINNRNYSRYKIYQASYYPLNTESIVFPSVNIKMIKYRVARNPSFFGRNRKQDFKNFYTKPKTVKVKPLHPHPLKEEVSVGNYFLEEDISEKELRTGESFNYEFTIKGEGNISAINNPGIRETDAFDFYSPNIQQNSRRGNNRVTGTKSFSYYGIPNEPGQYDLSNYFRWIYFNPEAAVYDTLQSSIVINVTGESKRNQYIMSNDLGAFYDIIEFEQNKLSSLHDRDWLKLTANIFILVMLVLTAVFIFRK